MTPPPLPRSYDEARSRVLSEVEVSLERLSEMPSAHRREDELVLCLRLHPDMLAKTYEPVHLFAQVPALRNVGSRPWRAPVEFVKETERTKKLLGEGKRQVDSRVIFVQGARESYRQLMRELHRAPSETPSKFQEDIRKIERFDLLEVGERLQGFEEWDQGRVELVFHPTKRARQDQLDFLSSLFSQHPVNLDAARMALYNEGPTFVSVPLSREELQVLEQCNPLRAAHPLSTIDLRPIRRAPGSRIPPPPDGRSKSSIIIGVFDGGVDVTVPAISPFVTEDAANSIQTTPLDALIEHGTAVAGALLYGSLEKHANNRPLPTPAVSVVSFRVLPTSDPDDEDLYEVIDVIEQVVPARPDIRTFNLSLGPEGPILEDRISRFTFALDRLALERGVGFVCAAGNDGDVAGYDRIQSPADLVNGLGVGAYSLQDGKRVRASYSCVGPGREGAKVKPDFLAYGGCEQSPFHLVSPGGGRAYSCGTSFAAPLASRLQGLVRGFFDQASTLMARVLMAHASEHPSSTSCRELGWGFLPENWEDVLYSADGAVTVIFQGTFMPGKFNVLPIPIPKAFRLPGNVSFRWTIGALAPVNASHPGDYTSCCIEDKFYPNSQVHSYSTKMLGKREARRLHDTDDAAEIAQLMAEGGWKKSTFPVTKSANLSEQDLRATELKWDSIVKRSASKQGDKLDLPVLILRTVQRREHVPRFDYAVAVTIRAKSYKGDLFSDVVATYPILQPIRVRSEAEVMIPIMA